MALILAGGVLISACDDAKNSSAAADNFVAEVSGAVTGQVSGPGIIRFLPPSDVNFGTRPGYFFVAEAAVEPGIKPKSVARRERKHGFFASYGKTV